MTRRCSHCSHNGHNSRTCPNRGVRLFGVRLTDGAIRKSASMGNLSLLAGSSGGASPADGPDGGGTDGYASDDFVQGSRSSCRERKKGVPWTEEEHRRFLLGLQRLGKGDWRGISRSYVVSRTPTQVASHAQKYFIRQTNVSRRKRRTSLFDMIPDEGTDLPPIPSSEETESPEFHQQVAPLPPPPLENEPIEPSVSVVGNDSANPLAQPSNYPVIVPAYFSALLPFAYPAWSDQKEYVHPHEILKPLAVHWERPADADELVGISKLSIMESDQETVSTSLSLSLTSGRSQQSAFHANPTPRAQAETPGVLT